MDNFCLPIHADYIADSDLWRTYGYLRSSTPPAQPSPSADRDRDDVTSLRSPAVDDTDRQSSNVYHQQQQQLRAPSPIDDISNEPIFSFPSRVQSNAYRYRIHSRS